MTLDGLERILLSGATQLARIVILQIPFKFSPLLTANLTIPISRYALVLVSQHKTLAYLWRNAL